MLGKLILWGDLQKVLIADSEEDLSKVWGGAAATTQQWQEFQKERPCPSDPYA